jgi:flagellar hook assembly protein FlgD
VTEPAFPQVYALYPNVPNPFNPSTAIRCDVPAGGGKVTLRVFDVSGRLVRTLVNGNLGPGTETVTWDGRDDRGEPVSSGVYFYRMTAPGFEMTHKMVFVQ